MRKNLLFGLFATMVLLLTTACQKENDLLGNGEATISFEISTPQMATRAFSDGNTATKLWYAVYHEVNGEMIRVREEESAQLTNKKAHVDVRLATGKSYYVLFWAQADNAPYKLDFINLKMNVVYADAETNYNALCNDESRDAFYWFREVEVNGAATVGVTLTRPFAQLNIGTNDLDKLDGVSAEKTSVSVQGVYNTLNLVTGKVEGDAITANFALNDRPNKGLIDSNDENWETFPVAGYDYLAMNYLLVADQKVVDVEFSYGDNSDVQTRTFTNIPVKANHRTNIYGALLTNNIGFDVEIEEDFDEPDENLYYVSVDGVHYTDFAEAVTKALELNKPIDFITDVKIDADNTITVPAGKELTLNLNGCTLSGVSDQTGANRNMFDVRGTMTVNGANTMTRAAAEGNGIISIKHLGENMKWDSSTNVFNVTAGGVLNIMNVNAINYGGSDMGFVAHLNNWGEVTLNVENSTLESNYVAVRVFNSGPDKNNVTIQNSTLKGGSYAFWVQCYTSADFNGKVYSGSSENYDQAKVVDRLNFDIFNGTNTFIGKNDTPIRFGFTDALYADQYGAIQIKDAEGNVVEGIGMDMDGNYAVSAAAGLEYLSTLVAADDNNFEGKTVKLAADIDLTDVKTNGDSFAPIGSTGERDDRNRLICEAFKGTFDGQGHTIKGIYQSGWDMGYDYDNYGSIGLFSVLEGATVKNIVIDGLHAEIERGDISFIAGSATGTCVFENITIKNSSIGTFDNGNGGIIGWSGAGEYTFKNITLESDVVIGGLWGSFDQSCGGIVGQAEPGATYNFEKVTISCRLDVFNDVTASYQYYLYRMCGMIIGRCEETTTINGANYPDLSKYNMTFNNVVVNYGDWMNYHYCHGPYGMKGNAGRVEPGIAYGGLDINAPDHNDKCTEHMQLIPFDQLIGGDQLGVRGLREVNGVTVNYPASYRREVSSAAALTEALGKGVSVVLDADIDYGTTQLAITGENQVVDLGGHTLTTANNWGGISLKNGATIKNGTITHAGNTAAIKAFNGSSVENVTINATCSTADKTVTGIAVQQGANVESIKNVTINGVSQGIEVGYQATVGLIENAVVNESNNGTAKGIGLVINGGKVGKAKNCTFKGETYGVTLHLKGVFAAGLDLENCEVEGTTASIYAWDEKGISNTSGSLVLTYDEATILTGPFVWDFEDECKSVVTLNKPE